MVYRIAVNNTHMREFVDATINFVIILQVKQILDTGIIIMNDSACLLNYN